MAKMSVSWSNHLKNIGHGLSALQQNSEFVDMTLAADGHLVKVHQLVMAISSPYIKSLIAAAACPHPVIYLNKISHATLSSILEYIYTGEVTVALENLSNLLETAKELHIKGLEDMDIAQLLSGKSEPVSSITSDQSAAPEKHLDVPDRHTGLKKRDSVEDSPDMDTSEQMSSFEASPPKSNNDTVRDTHPQTTVLNLGCNALQYTVSNRGSLQLILNRFLYYLKYTNKKKTRQWRCVEYINNFKCPAYVVTKDDSVIQRVSAHSHPFHDKRILKKVKSGSIFTALNEAETKGASVKVLNKISN